MIVVQNARFGMLARYVGLRLVVLFVLDVAIAVAYVFGGWTWLALPDIPLSIFGGVIGVIAGFRNTSAYARWWEARVVWGGIVNNSRSFARQVLTMIDAPYAGPPGERGPSEIARNLVRLQIAWVHALRNHLRGLSLPNELDGLIPEPELNRLKSHSNVPLAIQHAMASLIGQCHRQGWLDEIRWTSLDRTLSALTDGQGASERIKNTPMPRLYDLFIRRVIGFYCVLLPLAMVQSLRLLTPFGSTFVGFIFLMLDQIGRDLETPFENLPYDVPLTAISRTVEINLKQMTGDKDIPEPLAPVDGILW